MRAAYSSGVANALLEAEVYPEWVGGISAGASCTSNYLVRDQWRTSHTFTDFAQHDNFGGIGSWVHGRGYFNAEWMYEHTADPGGPLPFDFQAFRDNPAQFGIGAIRCVDGEMVYWTREDVHTELDLMRRVRASSTMPILMPWTTIDGVTYCDGALGPTGGFALDAARAAGFSRFVVVMTRTRSYVKGPQRAPRAMHRALRRYPAVWEGLMARPGNYNRCREELFDLERDGAAYLVAPSVMPIHNSQRNVAKLRRVYQQGLSQGRRELPAIREFVGL